MNKPNYDEATDVDGVSANVLHFGKSGEDPLAPPGDLSMRLTIGFATLVLRELRLIRQALERRSPVPRKREEPRVLPFPVEESSGDPPTIQGWGVGEPRKGGW